MSTIAERLFGADIANYELEEQLSDAGVEFEKLGWDNYDCSLEIYNVPNDYKMTEDALRVVYNAGFCKLYVNHIDKWETHYNFDLNKKFIAKEGWRVSYPHKRNDTNKSILVEKEISTWPKDWFETSYAKVIK